MKLKQWIQIFPILSGIMWGSAGIFVRKLSELGLNSVSIVETMFRQKITQNQIKGFMDFYLCWYF